ncbi:MAG: SHOCT domain-containing protein [Clostridium sp.]|nr:SHOCT domain-containing protein [Clostridium sp.]
MAKCPICKGKINSFNKTKALDGTICGYCASLCSSHSVMQVEEISEHWKKNNERWNVFKTTQKLKNIMSGVVSIDTDNEMFVFCDAENKKKIKITPIVFKYNEVIRYEKEIVGERNVSKKKGTLTRAVVGGAIAGPVGAIVGGGTAKTETKTVGGVELLKIRFKLESGEYEKCITNYPLELIGFLDKCIQENEKEDVQSNNDSAADEIMKYKNLLDIGAITQEEFEAKKKQLLNL